MLRAFAILLAFPIVTAQTANFTTLPSDQVVAEGSDATFRCAANDGNQPLLVAWRLRRGNEEIVTISANIPVEGTGGATVGSNNRSPLTLTSLKRSLNGVTVSCRARIGIGFEEEQSDPPASLSVTFPPEYSINPSQSTIVREGSSEYSYQFTLTANPVPTIYTWRRGSEEISNSTRITITVNSITIRNVKRSDSGTYDVTVGIAGMVSANFTLDVQYVPEYTGVINCSSVSVTIGDPFTFNCTPSDANPSSVTYSFRKNGIIRSVNGSVLTISSVARGDSGNYSCTATNSAGSTTVCRILQVVDSNGVRLEYIIPPVIIGIGILLILAGIILIVIAYVICRKMRKPTPERLSDEKDEEKL